jgi:hypothetical protein
VTPGGAVLAAALPATPTPGANVVAQGEAEVPDY